MVGLWSDYGRERFYERILKTFGFLKSVAQAALKCPKPLFSISFFKKIFFLSIRKSDFKNFWFFGISGSSRTKMWNFLLFGV